MPQSLPSLLSDPDPDSPDWQQESLCRPGRIPGLSSDDFFYEGRFRTRDGEDSDGKVKHETRLRAICAACPVNEACDEWATANREDGFWAGLTAEQRASRRNTLRKRKWIARKRLEQELMLTLESSRV